MTRRTRRDVLKTGSAGIAAGLAGCAGTVDGDSFGATQPTDATAGGEDATKRELRARIAELEQRVEYLESRTEEDEGADSAFSDEVLSRATEMAHAARRSVVTLRAGSAGGTGWILEGGYVVTNSHVVVDSPTVEATTFDGETANGRRIGYHEDMTPDVALVETELTGPDPLPTGSREALSRGDPLVTIGHPGVAGEWIITIGRYERYEPRIDWLLSTVPTSQGNSGGPLLTLDGEVAGVVSGGTSEGPPGESDLSKSDTVYEELPERETLTTSTSVETLLRWVDEWTSDRG